MCIKVQHRASCQSLLWWDLEIPNFSQEIFLLPERYTSCKTSYTSEFSLPLKQKSKTISYHFLSKHRSVMSPSSRSSEEVVSEVLILTTFYNNIVPFGQAINYSHGWPIICASISLDLSRSSSINHCLTEMVIQISWHWQIHEFHK